MGGLRLAASGSARLAKLVRQQGAIERSEARAAAPRPEHSGSKELRRATSAIE